MKNDKKKVVKPPIAQKSVQKPAKPMQNATPALEEKPKEKRQFTPDEVRELQELYRIASSYGFLSKQILGNSALIPEGQKIGAQFEAIARLTANLKQHWISQKLAECGYTPEERVDIDMETGLIVPHSAIAVQVLPKKK